MRSADTSNLDPRPPGSVGISIWRPPQIGADTTAAKLPLFWRARGAFLRCAGGTEIASFISANRLPVPLFSFRSTCATKVRVPWNSVTHIENDLLTLPLQTYGDLPVSAQHSTRGTDLTIRTFASMTPFNALDLLSNTSSSRQMSPR